MPVAQSTAHTAHAQGRVGDPFGWRCVGVGCVRVTAPRSAVKWTCIDFMLLQACPTQRSHALQQWQAGKGCSCNGVKLSMIVQVRVTQSQLLACLSLQQKGHNNSRGRRLQSLDLDAVQDGAGVVGRHKGVPGLGRQRCQVDLVIHLSTPHSSGIIHHSLGYACCISIRTLAVQSAACILAGGALQL